MQVTLVDSTLREGEQTPNVHFSLNQKIEIARAIDVFFNNRRHMIELGSPYVPQQFEDVKLLSNLGLKSQTMSHCRALKEDIDDVLKCNTEWVVLYIASSEHHRKAKLNGMSRQEALEKIQETTQYAKDHGLKVRVCLEDASKTHLGFLIEAAKTAEEFGADRISVPDTRGIITPLENKKSVWGMKQMITELADDVKVPLDVHCHNDFGLATINSLVGLESGANGVHVCVNGLGERAGITPLHELVLCLYVFYGLDLGVQYESLTKLSDLVGDYSGIYPRDNDPIVGRNAFSHKAGTHQKAMSKDPTTFEIFDPGMVGNKRKFIMSELAGKHGVEAFLKECNITVSPEILLSITNEIKDFEHEKGFITNQDVIGIIQQITGEEHPSLYRYGNISVEALVSIKLKMTAKPGVNKIVSGIKTMRGVETLWEVTGIHDIIVLTRANSIPELNICLDRLRAIEGIDSTSTYVVMNKWR